MAAFKSLCGAFRELAPEARAGREPVRRWGLAEPHN
jgi:hypothetical protein